MGLQSQTKKILFIAMLALTFVSAGCAGNVYSNVFNDQNSPNVKNFDATADVSYNATKKAVLLQNFKIEKEDIQGKSLTAVRYFEDGKDSTVLTININVMDAGQGKSTVYASAVQHREVVRVTTDRTFFGLVPVGSTATKTKQNEKTIEDTAFYEKLFAEIEKELPVSLLRRRKKEP
ncbi:MAG: DUF2242 domain-containing protein [Nitrospirae bacterium]|nr:DUF2242 domain-containing protein [Nitrospirota bacterium]